MIKPMWKKILHIIYCVNYFLSGELDHIANLDLTKYRGKFPLPVQPSTLYPQCLDGFSPNTTKVKSIRWKHYDILIKSFLLCNINNLFLMLLE